MHTYTLVDHPIPEDVLTLTDLYVSPLCITH